MVKGLSNDFHKIPGQYFACFPHYFQYSFSCRIQILINLPKQMPHKIKISNLSPQILIQITFIATLALLVPIAKAHSSIHLISGGSIEKIMQGGEINANFTPVYSMGCSMPNLYIYEDENHQNYDIVFENVSVISIEGQYSQITVNKKCITPSYCQVLINNNCIGDGKNQINLIKIQIDGYPDIEYKVICAPDLFYKPFEWGLFLLIILCTITIVCSSMFSKAWSYGSFSVSINIWIVFAMDFFIIMGLLTAYFIPNVVSVWLKVTGSGIGTLGVMVCFSECLYLLKKPFLTRQIIWTIRVIDIISLSAGIIMTTIYWLTNGFWIINDVEAICTIISVIKIFKLRSLKVSILLLFSLLVIEILVGLIVHYLMETSYNNYVMNLFESPIFVVFPSITPELFRKCAWLPLTSIIMPGLVISYLRRFDVSRSTNIYLIIGYISFFMGSMLWIFVDMVTIHSLPFAILSEPVMFGIVMFVSWRRNQLKTLWNGLFYDVEIPDIGISLLRETQTIDGIASMEFQRMVEEVKADDHDIRDSEQI